MKISDALLAESGCSKRRCGGSTHSVSIVVIARNEEDHIDSCLRAALREADSVDAAEIVFVDCGSTDKTLEVALEFPVKVVKMSHDGILTAAAAREVGLMNCAGESIVFVDGDCVLEQGWTRHAIDALEHDAEAAGVMGSLDDAYVDAYGSVSKGDQWFCTPNSSPTEVDTLGGNAVYRRSALDKVGGFNPHIRSLEEQELCYRLRKAGYRVLCLPHKMATHYTEFRWSLEQVWRRYAIGLCDGYGQVLRSSIRNRFLWQYMKHENRAFLFLSALIAGLSSICVSLLLHSGGWFFAWMILFLSAFAYLGVKNRSIRWPLCLYFIWFLNSVALLKCALKPLKEQSHWQPDYCVVSKKHC